LVPESKENEAVLRIYANEAQWIDRLAYSKQVSQPVPMKLKYGIYYEMGSSAIPHYGRARMLPKASYGEHFLFRAMLRLRRHNRYVLDLPEMTTTTIMQMRRRAQEINVCPPFSKLLGESHME
jgi:hypothetical protein